MFSLGFNKAKFDTKESPVHPKASEECKFIEFLLLPLWSPAIDRFILVRALCRWSCAKPGSTCSV